MSGSPLSRFFLFGFLAWMVFCLTTMAETDCATPCHSDAQEACSCLCCTMVLATAEDDPSMLCAGCAPTVNQPIPYRASAGDRIGTYIFRPPAA